MTAPAYLAYVVLGGNLAIIVALLLGLARALARSGWPALERAAILRNAGLVLIAWFGAALVLAWLGFFEGAPDRVPTVEFGILAPILIGVIALARSTTLRRVVAAIPQAWVVGVQFYRTLGAVFLTLLAIGQLPAAFAIPAGVGDVLVGILAPVVALVIARGWRRASVFVLVWNIFGFLDLVCAVGTGFMTSPSPAQLLSLDAPNLLISAFPLVMIPVFAVPLSVLLHLVSLMKLASTRSRGSWHCGARRQLGLTQRALGFHGGRGGTSASSVDLLSSAFDSPGNHQRDCSAAGPMPHPIDRSPPRG